MTSRPRKPVKTGPAEVAAAWKPPGDRKDTPPRPVPTRVRKDKRQIPLELGDRLLPAVDTALAPFNGSGADAFAGRSPDPLRVRPGRALDKAGQEQ